MDLKKFDKQLAKLNKLYTFVSDEDNVDEVELDLLRSYVDKLRKTLGQSEPVEEVVPEVVKPAPKSKKKVEKAVEEPKNESVEELVEEPVIEEPVVEEIEAIEIIDEVEPEPVVVKKAKAPKKAVAAVAKTAVAAGGESISELFADFSANELKDKLSQSPIKDLTKAFSINEKIFTIKELFGGDADLFRSTMKDLDVLEDFGAAKSHLIGGPAAKFKWSEAGKFKKARTFIKTLRRRYN